MAWEKPPTSANTHRGVSHLRPRGHDRVSQLRDRISVADAARVRSRVETAAAPLKLRGAQAWVLKAVLMLTCDYKTIADTQLALRHVASRIVKAGGRDYDFKTIGRALAALTRAELITYQAARGRGAKATLAIHERFVADVSVLERDERGRVIVPKAAAQERDSVTFFSRPYKENNSKKKDLPPTPTASSDLRSSRPARVDASSGDTRKVLCELPAALACLPRQQRWALGAAIKRKLAKGFLPEQISRVLHAPMPADMRDPLGVALWRLAQNMPGVGPRLAPLQAEWDRAEKLHAEAAASEDQSRWYGEVLAVTSDDERNRLLRADEAKFGRAVTVPVAALASAGRRASRLFPGLPLGSALARWADEVLGREIQSADADVRPTRDLASELAIGGCACLVCNTERGIPRPALPLRSAVCDLCWPMIAAELAGGEEAPEQHNDDSSDWEVSA